MRKSTLLPGLIFGLLTLSLVSLTPAVAQDAAPAADSKEAPKAAEAPKAPEAPAHFYHLDIVIEQVDADGKPTNSRTYTTTVSTGRGDRSAAIRTGSRVEIGWGTGAPSAPSHYQSEEIGVNIDAQSAREVGNKLSIFLSADVSSVADRTGEPENAPPAVNQNKWQGQVLIPVGKPTVVFSSGNLGNKGSMQMVVTATLL